MFRYLLQCTAQFCGEVFPFTRLCILFFNGYHLEVAGLCLYDDFFAPVCRSDILRLAGTEISCCNDHIVNLL